MGQDHWNKAQYNVQFPSQQDFEEIQCWIKVKRKE